MNNSFVLNGWLIAIIGYLFLALATLIPTILALFRKIELNPGGISFDQSTNFSEDTKIKLQHHYTRIQGTLKFWKNKAELHKYFHYYCIAWTIPVSILIPILTQFIDGSVLAKTLLTIISAHSAIIIALHKAFKVESNYKAFRQGESEFYDMYREFLDTPSNFGKTEEEQLNTYFEKVQIIRKYVRNAELDNFPNVESSKHNNSEVI